MVSHPFLDVSPGLKDARFCCDVSGTFDGARGRMLVTEVPDVFFPLILVLPFDAPSSMLDVLWAWVMRQNFSSDYQSYLLIFPFYRSFRFMNYSFNQIWYSVVRFTFLFWVAKP